VQETEKKAWIDHFQVDTTADPKGIGKTDFNFKLYIKEQPSVALRDFLREDLQVQLWESRPILKELKAEDGTVTREIVYDTDDLPKIENIQRGTLRFPLNEWVFDSNLMSVEPKLDSHQIAYFFKQENLKRPEF